MLRKLLFGAGAAYMARKFMGSRGRSGRSYNGNYNRGGGIGSALGGLFGGNRTSRRGMNW